MTKPDAALHVVHLDAGHQMRGGQWQVLELMEELRHIGVSQTLLAPGGSPLLEKAEAAAFEAAPLSLAALWRQTRRASLIHAHDARSHSMALFFRHRLPLIVSRRVAFPVRPSVLSRRKYARATLFLAVSHYVKSQLASAGVPDSKILVVPDGVRVPPAPASGAAVLALESSDPGKCGPLISEAARVAEIPIHFSRDLPRDLPRASVFVYLSESEGLGSAALLAMAHGVPVIASRMGGLPEAVLDGVTGLLTKNDAASVAHCLRRLLGDESLRRELASNARERVRQFFAIQQTAELTLAAYRRILAPTC